MRLPSGLNWLPAKIYAIDADTQKPIDPNVGRKMQVTYYDIKKNKDGSKSMVAHKSPKPSEHGGSGKAEKAKKDGNDGKGGKDEKKANGGNENQMAEDKEWTAEEDAKLKEMKAQNKTWKEIEGEMGRPKYQLQARFKQIKDTNDGGEADKKKDNGGDKADKKKDKGGEKADKKKDEGGIDKAGGGGEGNKQDKQEKKSKQEKKQEKKQATKEATGAKAASKSGSRRETKFTMQEWTTLQEDELFTFGELQLLTELVKRDQDLFWLRIAANFYDKTGRRVHPDDVREKFEQMDRLLG